MKSIMNKILILLLVVSLVAGMILPATADDRYDWGDDTGKAVENFGFGNGNAPPAKVSAVSVTGADKGQGGAPGVSGGEDGMGSIDHDGDGGTD